MENLKKAADASKVAQTFDGISKYIDRLSDECDERIKKSLRADTLMLFTFVGYFAVMLVALFGDLDPVIRRLHTELIFLVELIAVFRAWHFTKEWRAKEGEWDGAINVLRLLGMLPEAKDRGVKNKKPLFSEGVEMVKRWFTQKKEAQEKVYAPA